MFYSGEEGFMPLLTTVHLIDSGLLDGWLRGSSVRSTKDLGLSKYIVLFETAPYDKTPHWLRKMNQCMFMNTANNLGNSQP